MAWYHIASAAGLLISIVIVLILTITHRQYKTGKRGEIASYLMLASMSTMVGVAFNSMYSLAFYFLSLVLGVVALILGMKAMKVQTTNENNK